MEEYIKRSIEGDSTAYEYIVTAYQDKIYRYVNKLISNKEDAKEVTQDVFIAGYYKLEKYNDQYSFSTWLYKIAKNIAMNYIKKNERKKSLFERLSKNFVEVESTESDGTIFSDPVEYALGFLSDDDKNLLLLKSVEELSYREISFILKKREATLRKRYERIKRKFTKKYEEGRISTNDRTESVL